MNSKTAIGLQRSNIGTSDTERSRPVLTAFQCAGEVRGVSVLQTVLLYLVTLAFLVLLVVLAFRYPVAILPLAAYLGILFPAITGRKKPPPHRGS